MKTIMLSLLLFFSGTTIAETVYRCDNTYSRQPCYGQVNKILYYTPASQEQIDNAEIAVLQRELENNIEHNQLQSLEWQEFRMQQQAAMDQHLQDLNRLYAYLERSEIKRAQALLNFKHGREYEIRKEVKDRDNNLLDNYTWQSIINAEDSIWHGHSRAIRTPRLSERRP